MPLDFTWRVRTLDAVLCEMIQRSWDMDKYFREHFEIEYDPKKGADPIEWVLDILGIPEDNTGDEQYMVIDAANAMGEWPEWGTCRDYWYGYKQENPGAEPIDFINAVRHAVRHAKDSPYYPKGNA